MRPSTQSIARAWRHVRVWLVGLHVVAILVMAIPNTGPGLNRSSWRNQTVQDELETWAERLSSLGIEVTPKALEDWAYAQAKRMHTMRSGITAPFEPYRHYVGVRQPWNMFVAPHRHPAVLVVDVRVEGKWRPLYRVRSDEYDYRRAFFDHDRIRAMLFRYGWPVYRTSYDNFARWLAKQIARDVPEADKARMLLERVPTPTPEQAREGFEAKRTVAARVVLDLAPFREMAE